LAARRITGRRTAIAVAAAAVLFLPLAGGCSATRLRPAEGPPADVSPAHTPVPEPPPAALSGEKNQAYAYYASAVALDLEAAHLEEIFTYQRLSMGTKQPSLLRDAKKLRAQALHYLDLAHEEDPASAPVVRRKGDILMSLGGVEEAVALYEEADALGPAEPRWYFRTAGQLELLNRMPQAAALLEKAVSSATGLSDELRRVACVELGGIYVRLGQFEDAEKAYRSALGLASRARPRTELGAALAAGLEQDPTGIRRTLVTILRSQGKLDEALEEARTAVEEAPGDVRTMATLAGVYEAKGDIGAAIKTTQDFVDGHGDSQMGVLALARYLAAAGRVDEAVARCKRFLADHGEDAKVRQEIVSTYIKAGRAADAEKFAFEGGKGGVPEAPVALSLLDVYLKDGKAQEALDLATKILDESALEPNVASEVFARLWGGLSLERTERFYSEYAAAHGENLAAGYGFARVLTGRGEKGKADELFVTLAEKGASYAEVYEAAADYLLTKGDAYRAATLLLYGVEYGIVPNPEITSDRIVDAAADPGQLASKLEADEPKYENANITLDQIVARLYSRGENDAKAEEFYRKALDGPTPRLPDYAGLVISLYRQDKNDEAIAIVRKLRGGGQGSPALMRVLVAMLSKDGQYEQAREIAEGLIREQPTDVDNRLALVSVYVDEENYEAAAQELETARGLAEGDESLLGNVRYLLGVVYDEQGKDALALSMWQANLRVNPQDADSNNATAYYYAERGTNLEEALELVEKALAAEPENGAYLDTLGWVYYKMGDLKSAVDALTKAVEKSGDAVILDHLGDALLASGDASGAMAAWKRALSSKPKARDRANIEEKIKVNSSEGLKE